MTQSGLLRFNVPVYKIREYGTRMKDFDTGRVVNILANVGVIGGLVFLAFEIRQNNELLEQQSRAVSVGQMFNTFERFIENPRLLELAEADPDTLTPIEQRQRQLMGIRTLAAWEYQWGEWRRGLIDDFEWQTKGFRSSFRGEDALGDYPRDAWETYKGSRATPEFVDWMETNVVNK